MAIESGSNISRRDFLKGALFVSAEAAASAIPPPLSADKSSEPPIDDQTEYEILHNPNILLFDVLNPFHHPDFEPIQPIDWRHMMTMFDSIQSSRRIASLSETARKFFQTNNNETRFSALNEYNPALAAFFGLLARFGNHGNKMAETYRKALNTNGYELPEDEKIPIIPGQNFTKISYKQIDDKTAAYTVRVADETGDIEEIADLIHRAGKQTVAVPFQFGEMSLTLHTSYSSLLGEGTFLEYKGAYIPERAEKSIGLANQLAKRCKDHIFIFSGGNTAGEEYREIRDNIDIEENLIIAGSWVENEANEGTSFNGITGPTLYMKNNELGTPLGDSSYSALELASIFSILASQEYSIDESVHIVHGELSRKEELTESESITIFDNTKFQDQLSEDDPSPPQIASPFSNNTRHRSISLSRHP